MIQIAGALLLVGLIFLAAPTSVVIGVFILSQVIAGLDVLLMIVGRYFPIATLWGIRMENWLGPLRWKTND